MRQRDATHHAAQDWEKLREAVRERLSRNERIRCALPDDGRLRVDRQLPFLIVYRVPRRPDPGTHELATTEAAYLVSGSPDSAPEIDALCDTIAATLREHFGMMLFVELWAAEDEYPPNALRIPGFEIITAEGDGIVTTLDSFREALSQVSIQGQTAEVRVEERALAAPPGLPPLGRAGSVQHPTSGETRRCVRIGLAVRPIYRDPQTGTLYPIVLQRLRRQLSNALRRAIFAFTGMQAKDPRLHYASLGPSIMARSTSLVDQQLCEVAASYDFLLQVTPVNAEEAWIEFLRGGCRRLPRLYYRPLPYNPALLKRRLFEIPIEDVEDPTLGLLFQQKQSELDVQIAGLRDIDTPRFCYSSLQLYGRPDDRLYTVARRILAATPPDVEDIADTSGRLDAAQIAARAREVVDAYHQQYPGFTAHVEIRNDIASGLMVTGDRLLVSESFYARPARVYALLEHEISTHLLTYFNGRGQPLRQLSGGLAYYESLQEGLAVLGEYLVGGLTLRRLRVLAARLIAVASVLEGAPFADIYDQLTSQYRLRPRSAFTTLLRAHRGGGLTKDWLYLRGLSDVLGYLQDGHELEPLYVGKIALQHVPFLQDLRCRGIVRPPALLPRFWKGSGFRERLESCRRKTVENLFEEALARETAVGAASEQKECGH